MENRSEQHPARETMKHSVYSIVDIPKDGDKMRVGDLLVVDMQVWEVQRVNAETYELLFVGNIKTSVPIEGRGLVMGISEGESNEHSS